MLRRLRYWLPFRLGRRPAGIRLIGGYVKPTASTGTKRGTGTSARTLRLVEGCNSSTPPGAVSEDGVIRLTLRPGNNCSVLTPFGVVTASLGVSGQPPPSVDSAS